MSGGQKLSDDYHFRFKMIKSTSRKNDNNLNGALSGQWAGYGPEHEMVLPSSLLARIDVPERQSGRATSANGRTFSLHHSKS